MLKHVTSFILIVLIALSPIPAGAIKYKGDLEANESLTLPEQSAPPANPPSGKHKLYFKNDGAPYSLDSSGNENPITGSGFKNYLINGGFRIWQRGTSFTTMDAYGADRWKHGSGGTATVSRQSFALGQTDVPGEPEFYWRNNTTVAGSATATVLRQRIEDVRTLAGQTATLSFWAKAGAAKTFQIVIQQVFGTGGTPSADMIALNQAQSIGTAWTQYTYTVALPSISGKTLGTNNDDYLEILIQETAGFSTFTLDTTQWQLEKGSVSTEFEYRPIGVELLRARRYFRTVIVTAGGIGLNNLTTAQFVIRHEGMREAPSVTVSAPIEITNAQSANFVQSSASISFIPNEKSSDGGRYEFGNFTGLT
ncbi:MAG: hypothetical protein OEM27_06925, partial [Nitrospinota bacterium]|nr:hypothetical protein [Nitrospinota bacterium]